MEMAATQTRTRSRRIVHDRVQLDHVPEPNEAPNIARALRKAWGARPAGRLDLKRICDRLGVEVSVVSLEVPDGGAQGFLIPRANGFLIEVDPEPRGGWQSVSPSLRSSLERHRKRFLIAHELAHTLFYEDRPARPRRLVFDSVRQEAFCDELARALLVPQEIAATLPFTPEGVVELQRRFDVSMEVALRSSVASHPGTGIAWLLLQRHDEMRVQWTSADRSLTARALRALRKLATRASRNGSAETGLVAPNRPARALYLPHREQVIVTLDSQTSGSAS